MGNESLKTLAFDIEETVFENEHVGFMYITKDYNTDTYIVAIPVLGFSMNIVDYEDYEILATTNMKYKHNLIEVIKEAIAMFKA